jgi:hypothetical protein
MSTVQSIVVATGKSASLFAESAQPPVRSRHVGECRVPNHERTWRSARHGDRPSVDVTVHLSLTPDTV